jgi:hypothetical protein
MRERNVPIASAAAILFFENLFSGLAGNATVNGQTVRLTATQAVYRQVARANVDNDRTKAPIGGLNATDWTALQETLDTLSTLSGNAFYHPQYAALAAFSSIASSDYHGAAFTLRHRFKNDLAFDVNYTFSKSFDDASTLEAQAATGAFIRNPLNLRASRAVSNFDARHNFNANWLAALPFGKDKLFFGKSNRTLDAVIGGWQLTGIVRMNSGLPIQNGLGAPFELGTRATNWQQGSSAIRLRDIQSSLTANVNDPTGVTAGARPNLFADPTTAFRSFRSPRAGEVGDRNILRLPMYFALDAGLGKSFKLPWEGHQITFRWEVFNVTNTQPFGVIASMGLPQDPYLGSPGPDFGRFIDSQKPVGESRPGRVMQFALRYVF